MFRAGPAKEAEAAEEGGRAGHDPGPDGGGSEVDDDAGPGAALRQDRADAEPEHGHDGEAEQGPGEAGGARAEGPAAPVELVAEDDETIEYVAQLERRYDEEPSSFTDGESLVDEVERFLRDQD